MLRSTPIVLAVLVVLGGSRIEPLQSDGRGLVIVSRAIEELGGATRLEAIARGLRLGACQRPPNAPRTEREA